MASSSSPLPSSLGLLSSVSPSSPSSSSSLPQVMKGGDYINWLDLPPDLTSSILLRIGAIKMLENAQKVCRSWRNICKEPLMWRKIVMHELWGGMTYDSLEVMCRHAVDRSQGGLLEIEIWYFGTGSLPSYIADRSSNLRSLKLVECRHTKSEGLVQAVVKLPLLEELELTHCSLSEESLRVVGNSFPNLKTLKLNREAYSPFLNESDDEALVIAETMPGLRNLQLLGNKLSDTGLNTILDSCPNLEHLDLRQCFNVNLVGDLEKRCLERVKDLRHPDDSTYDCPFDASVITNYPPPECGGCTLDFGLDGYDYRFYDVDQMSDDKYYYGGLSDASYHSNNDMSDGYDEL